MSAPYHVPDEVICTHATSGCAPENNQAHKIALGSDCQTNGETTTGLHFTAMKKMRSFNGKHVDR
jgi:hypothetical protein